jgi:hypothetical protein
MFLTAGVNGHFSPHFPQYSNPRGEFVEVGAGANTLTCTHATRIHTKHAYMHTRIHAHTHIRT